MMILTKAQDIIKTLLMTKFTFMKFNFKIIITVFLTIVSLSCTSNSQRNSNHLKTNEMNNSEYEKQFQQIETLKKSMIEYMKTAQPSYSEKDVEQCENILIEFIQNIDKTTNRNDGLEVIKSTVLKLNDLNEKCDFQLIETGEREQIAEILITTGTQKGYNTINEDITEEWREW